MRADNMIPRIRVRKNRIRQRLDKHPCAPKSFRVTRRKAIEIVVGLSLLALCGAAAFRQPSNSIADCHYALPVR